MIQCQGLRSLLYLFIKLLHFKKSVTLFHFFVSYLWDEFVQIFALRSLWTRHPTWLPDSQYHCELSIIEKLFFVSKISCYAKCVSGLMLRRGIIIHILLLTLFHNCMKLPGTISEWFFLMMFLYLNNWRFIKKKYETCSIPVTLTDKKWQMATLQKWLAQENLQYKFVKHRMV